VIRSLLPAILALALCPSAALAAAEAEGGAAATRIDSKAKAFSTTSAQTGEKAVGAEKRGAKLYRSSLFPLPPEKLLPKEADRIIFSHKFHTGGPGLSCTDCHGSVAEATTTAASVRPKMEDCFECHDKEPCTQCHTSEDDPGATWAPLSSSELRFNHAAHLARSGITCATCHAPATESTQVDDKLGPQMAVCTDCHQAQMDRLNCKYCHTRLPELGKPSIGEAVHTTGFFALHGSWATGSAQLCASCHEQRFCADCHAKTTPLRPSVKLPEAVDRNFIHRGDFLGRHALEANAHPASCQTCHGQSFCEDCHRRSKASADVRGARSPHPAGYAFPGGKAFHGRDARVNIQACAACHDQGAASNCVTCHKVGGIGGNPHPPGFDRRGADDAKKNSRACIPCHQGGSL
jgi:hypothetical protein